jgi:hypothetical protein
MAPCLLVLLEMAMVTGPVASMSTSTVYGVPQLPSASRARTWKYRVPSATFV